MRTKYDPETGALYVRFADAAVVETEEVRPGVMFDFDADGRVVAIEVLDTSSGCPELRCDAGRSIAVKPVAIAARTPDPAPDPA